MTSARAAPTPKCGSVLPTAGNAILPATGACAISTICLITGLLDWRLAVEMTLLAFNPSADIDMETPWHTTDNPWWSLSSGGNSPVGSTLENLGYREGVTLSGLTAYRHQVFDTVSIVRHPLWTDEHPVYQAAKLDAEQIFKNCTVQALNPFEIIRRPASVLARVP